MTTESPRTTADAVRALLEEREGADGWTPEMAVLGRAAIRLAELVDDPDVNPSSAANAARELRQELEIIKGTTPAPDWLADLKVARHTRREEAFGAAQAPAEERQPDPPEDRVSAW